MDAIEMLKTRRSCRKYKKEFITDQELQDILDCGLNAPSGMNNQDVKIVVVKNKELRDQLSLLNKEVWGKDVDPFYGAPIVCVIFAKKESSNNIKDGSLVIGALQDAAYALNIGSCWINRAKEMFELASGKEILEAWDLSDYMGVGCCILGYPDQEGYSPKIIKEGRIKIID